MYEVSITSSAERDLKRLDRQGKNRIIPAILELATDPHARRELSDHPAGP